MTVATVCERLARIQGNITGVTKAFDMDEMPNKLNTAQLPGWITVPGEATYEHPDPTTEIETRLYYMLLYVAPIEAPSQIAFRMNLLAPFLDRVPAAFAARNGLESLAGVLRSELVADNGQIQPLEYGGLLYAGIEFRLQVVEVTEVTPVDYA